VALYVDQACSWLDAGLPERTHAHGREQTQLAVTALRIAQTHLLQALAKSPGDANLNGTWTQMEEALKALGCSPNSVAELPSR
jgi:hypothetical protein